MDSVVLCYARADEIVACNLANFLESNLPFDISCSGAIVGPDLDLIEAAERALSAEAALVLLSPNSVPKTWDRKTWEPVFLEKPKEFQTHLAYVRIGECKFPDLFLKGRFFDASVDALQAFREIKRWLLRPLSPIRAAAKCDPALEDLRKSIADQPGIAADISAEIALRFASDCGRDFEAIYRLDLGSRSRAGMAGDIRSVADRRYSGKTHDDEAMFRDWCANHRALFVLAGVNEGDREYVVPGGRTSVIFTERTLPESIPSAVAEAVRKFEKSLRGDIESRLRLGWSAVTLLKTQSRFAEASEVLEAMAGVSRRHGDTSALQRIEREQYWMRIYQDDSGDVRFAPAAPGGEQQLTFSFVA